MCYIVGIKEGETKMSKKPQEPLEFLEGRKPLSETELDYMKVIWEHPEGISSDNIYRLFPKAKGTKSTILFRISEKGYVNVVREGRHFLYKPQITKLEYYQALMRDKMKKNFGFSQLPDFIAAFCGKQHPSKETLQRVEDFIKELENE